MANKNLNAAKTAKKDEFYTQMTDIERELQHYWPHFRDKVVLCNCDDPYESNFFKYFALRFNQLGLKKLICTCYNGSPVQGNELMIDFGDFSEEPKKIAYKVEITEVRDMNGDGTVDLSDVRYLLQNDKNVLSVLKTGDFRDRECIELLKQADIVVTNPPFSLFREYFAQLIEYDRKFLIIGPYNALHYKEIFPFIKNNSVWVGYTSPKQFFVPQEFKRGNVFEIDNQKVAKFGNIIWFTNLDIKKRHEFIDLVSRYTPDEYPTYYNYDAIDVREIANIPCDYIGNMGVPDTILNYYNPEQFELIGLGRDSDEVRVDRSVYEKIKKLNPNARPSHIGFYDKSGKPKEPYSRIIIRNKHPKKL